MMFAGEVVGAMLDEVAARREAREMIRKLKSGEYRLYSQKKDPKTGKRRNLGTFKTREAAEKHERAVQFFKRQH
jgi:outer membrane lipoprotein SlyB